MQQYNPRVPDTAAQVPILLLIVKLPQLLRRTALICTESTSADLLIEHLVQIFKRPSLGLGYLEVDDNQGNKTQEREDPSNLAAQMGLICVVQVWHNHVPYGREEVVECESDSHGLCTETHRGDFSGYRHGWTDCWAVDPPGELEEDTDHPN